MPRQRRELGHHNRRSKLRNAEAAESDVKIGYWSRDKLDGDGPALPRRDGTGHDGDSESGQAAATEATPDAEMKKRRSVNFLRPLAVMRADRLPLPACLSSLTVPPRAMSGLSRSWCSSASISPFAISCGRIRHRRGRR